MECQDGELMEIYSNNEIKKLAKGFIPEELEKIKRKEDFLGQEDFKRVFEEFKEVGRFKAIIEAEIER